MFFFRKFVLLRGVWRGDNVYDRILGIIQGVIVRMEFFLEVVVYFEVL